MAERAIITALAAFAISAAAGLIAIPLLRKLKAGQTILHYLKEHYFKSGTPTMGGLFFIPSGVLAFFIFARGERVLAAVVAIITAAYMVVGFLDDFIKVRFGKNEGLTPLQKIVFQLAVAIIAGFFACKMGLTKVYVPFTHKLIELGYFSLPLTVFVFLATTNCVNLTDGLDGLAATVSAYAFSASAILIFLQTSILGSNYVVAGEHENIALLLAAMSGALCGFLLYNTNKASVFMGDTGSLALGGLFASAMIFSGNTLYIPVIGIMFVLSGISVIMQVTCFKLTGKRIFLMSPLHHHFQHKGYGESKIAFGYGAVTAIAGALAILAYLG